MKIDHRKRLNETKICCGCGKNFPMWKIRVRNNHKFIEKKKNKFCSYRCAMKTRSNVVLTTDEVTRRLAERKQCACGNYMRVWRKGGGRKHRKVIRNSTRYCSHKCPALHSVIASARRKGDIQIGKRFGRLVVIKQIKPEEREKAYHQWLCKCDCGKLTKLSGGSLRKDVKSCGCFKLERFSKVSIKYWAIPSEQIIKRLIEKSNCLYCGSQFFVWWISEKGITPKGRLQLKRKHTKFCCESHANLYFTANRIFNGTQYKTFPKLIFTAFGETKSIGEWSKDPRCCVSYPGLYTRIVENKWSVEWAIMIPPSNNTSRFKGLESIRRDEIVLSHSILDSFQNALCKG